MPTRPVTSSSFGCQVSERLRSALREKDPLKRCRKVANLLDVEEVGDRALLPYEANVQLANVILTTKLFPECVEYFQRSSTEMPLERIASWNARIEQCADLLTRKVTRSVAGKALEPEAAEATEEEKEAELKDTIVAMLGGD